MTAGSPGGLTHMLAEYASGAIAQPLPPPVEAKARLHIVDTLAACMSGTALDAGRAARAYAASLPAGACPVFATDLALQPVDAALVNGMTAHADESDDTHAASLTHPGSVVVPAAFAVAAHVDADDAAILRAVVLGYDVCCRVGRALDPYAFFARGFDTHAFGGVFGAAAAAGALLRLDAAAMRACFSLAAQQASGITTWVRDRAHVEKAFDFAGMPAQAGVRAGMMAASGIGGVEDVFDGTPGFLSAYAPDAPHGELVADLGQRFEVLETSIKKWLVATPAQAALDALYDILSREHLPIEQIDTVVAEIPPLGARVVTGRTMPNVDARHLLGVMMVDGTLTFASSHDAARMTDPAVLAAAGRVGIRPLTDVDPHAREARVTVTLADGRQSISRTRSVRGTPANPMTRGEVIAKAHDLLSTTQVTPSDILLIDKWIGEDMN